jgi:hypothetical protein
MEQQSLLGRGPSGHARRRRVGWLLGSVGTLVAMALVAITVNLKDELNGGSTILVGGSCPPGAPGPCGEVELGIRLMDCFPDAHRKNCDCCRPEIFHDNEWGTICDNGADNRLAKVACKQVGRPSTRAFVMAGQYNSDSGMVPGTGEIWLTNVFCTQNPATVGDCRFEQWGNTEWLGSPSRIKYSIAVECA